MTCDARMPASRTSSDDESQRDRATDQRFGSEATLGKIMTPAPGNRAVATALEAQVVTCPNIVTSPWIWKVLPCVISILY